MADDRPAAAALDPASPSTSMVTKIGVIDWPGLESRYAHHPPFVDRLAEVAVTSMRGIPVQLREHADAGRTTDIAAVAHSLRTGAHVIMAFAARDLAEATEKSCRDGAAEASALARSLAAVVEQLLVELQNRLDRRRL